MTSAPLDVGRLAERVATTAARWRPATKLVGLTEISGGSSGLTLSADLVLPDGEACAAVVKVAPPGLAPTGNRDVLRQAQMQRRLRDEGTVPVPGVLFEDAGAPPDVPPFFVMRAVAGVCFEPLIDAVDVLPPPAQLRGRALRSVKTLAALHRLDPAELGLGREPVVALTGEVRRWDRMLAASRIGLGELPARCVDALLARRPETVRPTIVHGDYRLGNQICEGPAVRAIIDWEIWTISDPRIDLGWFLMTVEPDGLPSAVRPLAAGLPSPAELRVVYETAVGHAVEELPWFSALARLRAAAAMSLNIKHNRRRAVPSERIEAYAGILPDYLQFGLELLAG